MSAKEQGLPNWLDQLTRANAIAVGLGDFDGWIVNATPALLSLLGYTLEEVDARQVSWRALTPPEYRSLDDQVLADLRSNGHSPPLTKEFYRKDGARVPVLLRAMITADPDRILMAVLDLTHHRQAEGRLVSRQEGFQIFADSIKDLAIFLINPEGVIVTWNAGAERMCGYSSQEILGSHFSRFQSEESKTAARGRNELNEAIHHGQLREEGWRLRKDGSRFWASVLLSPIHDSKGKLQGFSKIIRDMSERRSSEVLLRSVLDNTLDGIISIDALGNIRSFNLSARKIFGYQEEDVLGKNVKLLMPEPYHSEHDQYIDSYLKTGVARIIGIGREVTGRRKDGSTFPMDLAVSEFNLDGDRHFSGIVRDISERRKLEDQLRQAQKMEAIGQLAGGVAHDFNNLLTIIAGHSEILLQLAPADSPLQRSLQEIKHAGERAAALTRQLLAFSRQSVLQTRVLNLNDLVENLQRMLGRLIGEDINQFLKLDPGISRVQVDAGQIEQVLMNLTVNARDAMPRGGKLTIETSGVMLDEHYCSECVDVKPGRYVLLSVSDTGEGITPDNLKHVFEPFFTTKEPGKGTGLGLATVYGIVKQSGGHVAVYSELGVGTTFKVYLPAIDAPASVPESAAPTTLLGGKETILLTEDDSGVRTIIRFTLEMAGFRILEAASGAEAVQLSRQLTAPLHLLVTDVVMPEMSGRQLADLLRTERPDLKVLFLSGYTDDAIVRHGILHADVAFLQKPFTPDALLRKVRAVLDEAR